MISLFDYLKLDDGKTFLIAEAGVNHNGDLRLAKALVDVAVEAKVNAVKFQTFKTEEIVSEFSQLAEYQLEGSGTKSKSQYEMLKELELSFDQFKELKNYCEQKNILFLSTPDDRFSLDFLTDEINVPLIKVGSTEVTNLAFLRQIAAKNLPIVMSTGMSSIGEVEKALIALNYEQRDDIIVLHCTTAYPTSPVDVNLRAMHTMREAFSIPVGYSDHTTGMEASIAAVALGAVVIERHFTLDRDLPGPDHKASLDPDGLKQWVEAVRTTEFVLGNARKVPTPNEQKMKEAARRSIVAHADLSEGSVLIAESLTVKRPGTGIEPSLLPIITGRVLKRALKKDEPLLWEDI